MRFCDLYKMDIGEGNNISLALLLGDNMAIQSFFCGHTKAEGMSITAYYFYNNMPLY